MQKLVAGSLASVLIAGQMMCPVVAHAEGPNGYPTSTPIKHLVVIFQENVSFDHYFGTYPAATNPAGEPSFTAVSGTPTVNGLNTFLLFHNPNQNKINGSGASNPFRLDRTQAATADQDHDYTPEQQAFDSGLMDAFPAFTGTGGPPPAGFNTKLVMGYYDGNTVTALWNYAQRFAMSDNFYDTNFGPSTPGAINVISGQTNGVIDVVGAESSTVTDGYGGLTLTSDADPGGDVCSSTSSHLSMSGKNIGDLLNAEGVSWGFFSGGFDLTITNPGSPSTTGCHRSTTSTVTGTTKADYIPHHQPFQYYASTANQRHLRPSSVAMIGQSDQANHQYDIHDFFDAVSAGNFPAVSYLKAPGFQDGHAGYSDPLDEQTFVVNVLNFLQQMPDWRSTAVIITYDDSDGWYDHQMSPIVNTSATTQDALTGPGLCGNGTRALPGVDPSAEHAQGRCGFGPRLPFLLISPWAKQNYVDHGVNDQSSVVRFIEHNWMPGQRIGNGSFDTYAGSITPMFDFGPTPVNPGILLLDPSTGLPTNSPPTVPLPIP